jgi:plastocyanin
MKKVAVAFALVLAAFALAACGSSDDSSTESKSQSGTSTESQAESGGGAEGGTAGSAATVDFEAASSGLAYTSDSAGATAGKVTVNFTNPQPLTHDVAIEDSSGKTIGKTELVAEGSDSTTVDLKPGEYTFYCSVPGHREAGMEGTLTVK